MQSQATIYQLTQAIVGGESYRISPAICTRVATMVHHPILQSWHPLITSQRQAYTSFPDGNFWDEVDKILDSINDMPEEKRFRHVTPAWFDYSMAHCVSCPATSGQYYLVIAGRLVLHQARRPTHRVTTQWQGARSHSFSNALKTSSRHPGVPLYPRAPDMY